MQEHIELAVTSLTVHRLVICSVLLAVKMTDDRYYNNAFFAKIGGITVTELNTMELEMLKLLGFRTHVLPSEIKWLLSRLKSLQGPGQVTSVLCKRRIIRSVDDLPTLKQREIEPDMQSANITSGSSRPAEQIGVSSAASKLLSCQLSLSSFAGPATAHDMARSPSNGLSLPKLRVGNQQCSLQHNNSNAFPDDTSSIEVTV